MIYGLALYNESTGQMMLTGMFDSCKHLQEYLDYKADYVEEEKSIICHCFVSSGYSPFNWTTLDDAHFVIELFTDKVIVDGEEYPTLQAAMDKVAKIDPEDYM